MKATAFGSVALAFLMGVLCGMTMQEWLDDPPAHTSDCLPGDTCTMHIVPKDKPWLALTCDMQTNKCEDSKP